jgi:hypothetical protein
MGHRGRSRTGLAVAIVVASFSIGAGGLATATPEAGTDRAKKCEKAVVGGKKVCLRPGARCKARYQSDYLLHGFSCRGRKLARATPEERRGEEAVLTNEDGEIEMRTALEAFDQTVAPLPGLDPRKGTVGEPVDATFAIETIAANLGELTPEQRAVFDQVTTPTTIRSLRAPPSALEQQETQRYVDDAMQALERYGYTFPKPIHVNYLDNLGLSDPGTLAYVTVADVPGSPLPPSDNCELFMTNAGRALDSQMKRAVVAHEVVHCAQHAFYSSFADSVRTPQWVKEGGAQWLGWTIASEEGPTPPAPFAWNGWLRTPNADLFQRVYGAVGFFAMLEQGGTDMIERYKAVMRGGVSSGHQGAYSAAIGSGRPRAFDFWGPGFVRRPDLGNIWDLRGQGIVPSDVPFVYGVTPTTFEAIAAQPRSGVAAELRMRTEILILNVSRGVTGVMRDSVGRRTILSSGAYTTVRNFRCRSGRNLNLPYIGNGDVHVGFGGQTTFEYVIFQGMSKADYCAGRRPRPPRPGSTCSPPGGQTTARVECPVQVPGIGVYENDGTLLANFETGNCTYGDNFVATASDGPWELEVGINRFAGFDQFYDLIFGQSDPEVILNGPGGPYGNQAPAPSSEQPTPAGIIYLHPTADLGLGMPSAQTIDSTNDVAVAGVMDCKYPDE